MPFTTQTPAPNVTGSDSDDMNHIYCCDPDTGLCGTDVSGLAEIGEHIDIDCVVCADLDGLPCQLCSAP